MRFKPDWLEARERLTALWAGRRLDRPCISVVAPSGRNIPTPPPPTAEARWLEPDWVVPNALAQLENTWWGGEAIPSALIMGGWVVCLGGSCRFDQATICSDEFILPELELYAQEIGPLWYHLDGADARQYLPRLLGLKSLRVLQYTPRPDEPPNGPAHLAFYRRVQAAGKILHLQLPKENVLSLARSLDPALLLLHTGVDSPDEGRALLAAARG